VEEECEEGSEVVVDIVDVEEVVILQLLVPN
jgi:hypothetical protein